MCDVVFLGWSGQGGVSLSVNKAEAQARVYVTGYAATSRLCRAWHLVRREGYYFNGPWSGTGYSYTGWS